MLTLVLQPQGLGFNHRASGKPGSHCPCQIGLVVIGQRAGELSGELTNPRFMLGGQLSPKEGSLRGKNAQEWCRGLRSVLIPLQPQKDKHRNGRATNPVSALSPEGTRPVAPDKAAPRLPGGSNKRGQPRGGVTAGVAGAEQGWGALLLGQPWEGPVSFGPQFLCVKLEGEKDQTSKGPGACGVS